MVEGRRNAGKIPSFRERIDSGEERVRILSQVDIVASSCIMEIVIL
jgi:hypothetical protein